MDLKDKGPDGRSMRAAQRKVKVGDDVQYSFKFTVSNFFKVDRI